MSDWIKLSNGQWVNLALFAYLSDYSAYTTAGEFEIGLANLDEMKVLLQKRVDAQKRHDDRMMEFFKKQETKDE